MFGYQTFNELLKAIFKHYDSALFIKYILPAVLVINTVFEFLFQSVGGIWFMILLYLIDFITGVAKAVHFSLKAKKLRKEGLPVPVEIANRVLVSKKFPRFLLTLLAAMLLLALLNFAAIHSVFFIPLYSIFYGVFIAQNILSVAENLNEMGLLKLEVLVKLKAKVNESINL